MQNKIQAVLRALGYTPKTLAADIGVTIAQAKRILADGGSVKTAEVGAICKLTGMTPNMLYGLDKPGKLGKGGESA